MYVKHCLCEACTWSTVYVKHVREALSVCYSVESICSLVFMFRAFTSCEHNVGTCFIITGLLHTFSVVIAVSLTCSQWRSQGVLPRWVLPRFSIRLQRLESRLWYNVYSCSYVVFAEIKRQLQPLDAFLGFLCVQNAFVVTLNLTGGTHVAPPRPLAGGRGLGVPSSRTPVLLSAFRLEFLPFGPQESNSQDKSLATLLHVGYSIT